MQTYPQALNSRNEVVHVNKELPGGGPYTCLGCQAPMIARLKDDKRVRHFAHYSKGKCSGETYLHVLAKYVFKDTWQKCLREGKPFVLSLPRRFVCPHRSQEEDPCEIVGYWCTSGDTRWPPLSDRGVRTDYDLTQRYKTILMETGDAGFIPDLLLLDEDGKNKLYIEIKVKSAVSSEKSAAGHKIIEIPIQTADDIRLIDRCYLSVPEVKSYNFKLDTLVKEVPEHCEVLLSQERMRQEEAAQLRLVEARLREEEAAKDRTETGRQARLLQEQAILEVKRIRLKAEGIAPDMPTEWFWDGHPVRILFLRGVWVLSIDREYRGEFDTFMEANTRAERIVSKFGFPATGKVYETRRESSDNFLDEVLAVFGGRLLSDDEE